MDPARFDTLTRRLAGVAHRRHAVLTALAGARASALFGATSLALTPSFALSRQVTRGPCAPLGRSDAEPCGDDPAWRVVREVAVRAWERK